MIKYKLLADGSFVVGDTATGLTVYAYPTSLYATMARTMADRVAAEMMKSAGACTVPVHIRAEFDARNFARLT